MSTETVQQLLKKIYDNAENFDAWIDSPIKKTKEWGIDLDDNAVEMIRMSLQCMSSELEQIKEIKYVNQRSVTKLNEATKHNKWSFYSSLIMHSIAFVVGIIVLFLGIYASFHNMGFLGFFLVIAGGLEISYFLLKKPLQGLNENIGNLVQMEVALGAWFNEMAYWRVFLKDTRLEEKQLVAQAMRDAAKWTIMLIEDYCSIYYENRSEENVNSHKSKKTVQELYTRTKSIIDSLTDKIKERRAKKKQEKEAKKDEEKKDEEKKDEEKKDEEKKDEEKKDEEKKDEEKKDEEKKDEEKKDEEKKLQDPEEKIKTPKRDEDDEDADEFEKTSESEEKK